MTADCVVMTEKEITRSGHLLHMSLFPAPSPSQSLGSRGGKVAVGQAQAKVTNTGVQVRSASFSSPFSHFPGID